MAERRDILFRLLGDSRNLVKATDRGEKGLKGVEQQSGKTREGFRSLGARAAITFGSAGAIAGMLAWINEGTNLAQTGELIERSFTKTFGAASDLDDELIEVAAALGLTRTEMQQQLLVSGQLAKSVGLNVEEAEAFSGSLFTMAGDLAAFTGNLDDSDRALGALQAALKGEFDPLEQFGIKLTAASVQQRALADTGKETTAELTQQEIAMAALALIAEQMGDETGALADAMRDGATAGNELSVEMREAQQTVGGAFVEIKNTGTRALSTVIGWLESAGGAIGRFAGDLARMEQQGGFLGVMAGTLKDFILTVTTADPGAFFRRLGRGIDAVKRAIDGAARALRSFPSSIPNPLNAISRAASRIRGLLGFQTGGTVPGPTGSAQLAVVHGGEQVLTPQQQRGRGGGQPIVINVTAGALTNPAEVAREVVDLLTLYNRTTGPIDIQTRSNP